MKKTVHSKTGIILIVFLVVVLIAIAVVSGKYISTVNKPLSTNEEEITLSVNEGDSLYGVFNKLNENHIMKNQLFAKVYLKLHNVNGNIKAGTYKLNGDISLGDLVNTLQNGLVESNKITFPEGYSIDDIANRLHENNIVNKDEFLETVKNYPLPSYVKQDENKRYNLEGYLFPDTYSFSLGITANEIISMMINRFEQVMTEVQTETGVSIPEEDYERYVNMAAMIEKEARVNEDRPLVSSVIYNRLEKGMPLQLDATILYSLGQHKQVVTYKDLEVDSPYNTYKNRELPVGPIANPGKPSLIAAIAPEKTDYLFYLLAENNKHYFTNNYDDFLKKKKELGY